MCIFAFALFFYFKKGEYILIASVLNCLAVLCSWCGTWKGDKICSRCRRARYCSEKHEVLKVNISVCLLLGFFIFNNNCNLLSFIFRACIGDQVIKNDCRQIISSSEDSASTPGNSRGKLWAISKGRRCMISYILSC